MRLDQDFRPCLCHPRGQAQVLPKCPDIVEHVFAVFALPGIRSLVLTSALGKNDPVACV